ncbi:hypothetical protein Btru_064143 [Bulinus truncatus]|nr:hypothetical protein Btru_064143 [Bulinus truncatus]
MLKKVKVGSKVSLADRSEEKMKPGHHDKHGVDKGPTKLLTSGHLERRSSEYAPNISGRGGQEVNPTLSYVSYNGVTNLLELQKLLTQTEDSIERNQIRNVIRHLRQQPGVGE